MESPKNRVLTRDAPPKLQAAPPVAIPGKVTPCTSPCCGKAGTPIVKQTNADKGFARVQCSSCGAHFFFYYATTVGGMPQVRMPR